LCIALIRRLFPRQEVFGNRKVPPEGPIPRIHFKPWHAAVAAHQLLPADAGRLAQAGIQPLLHVS
jgi:hypothetical protein